MSHHIYQTDAFVIAGKNTREASRTLVLYTRELGLITVGVQGVRLLASKLRYGLQDFSRSTVALVRGRNGWRITSAIPEKNFYDVFKDSPEKLSIATHSLLLLARLTGEEKNAVLFDLIDTSFLFLETLENSPELLSNFESILVLRMLHNLGYVGDIPHLNHFVSKTVLNEASLRELTPFRSETVRIINASLKESHL